MSHDKSTKAKIWTVERKLYNAFLWTNSKKGWKYWDNVSKNLIKEAERK